jgi:hypothetical protein
VTTTQETWWPDNYALVFPVTLLFQMAEAEKCVDELDVDRDGRVSYPEFLMVWKYKN